MCINPDPEKRPDIAYVYSIAKHMQALTIANWVCLPDSSCFYFEDLHLAHQCHLKLVLLHRNETWHFSVQNIQCKAQGKAFGIPEQHKKDKKWPWPFNIALQRRKWKIKQCSKNWFDLILARFDAGTVQWLRIYLHFFLPPH